MLLSVDRWSPSYNNQGSGYIRTQLTSNNLVVTIVRQNPSDEDIDSLLKQLYLININDVESLALSSTQHRLQVEQLEELLASRDHYHFIPYTRISGPENDQLMYSFSTVQFRGHRVPVQRPGQQVHNRLRNPSPSPQPAPTPQPT